MSAILLVEDDDDLRDALVQAFTLDGFKTIGCGSVADAMKALATADGRAFDGAVVSDIRMPERSGMDLLTDVAAVDADIPVILMTGHGDVPLAVQAMRAGAYDFVEKPFEKARLLGLARHAVETRRLVLDNRALRTADSDEVPIPLRGASPVAVEMADRFRRLLEARAGALVAAPQGAGANRLVRDLAAPLQADGLPMRRMNCSNTGDLAELELFGPGGAFAATEGGVLVLDNIATLAPTVQRRIAEADERHDRVLVLSTMNPASLDPSLAEAFASRRLEVVPLSRRREDVPALFVALAQRAAARFLRPVPDLPAGFDGWLMEQPLEGNVGELQAMAEQFVLGLKPVGSAPVAGAGAGLAPRVAAHERMLIAAELARHGGRMRPTYEALGLSRKGLYDKMRRHGLHEIDDG